MLGEGGDWHESQDWDGDGDGPGATCLAGSASAISLGQIVRVAMPRELSRSRWEVERRVCTSAVGDEWIVGFRRLTPIAYSHSSSEGLKA